MGIDTSISDDERADIRMLHRNGWGTSEIAHFVGLSVKTTLRVMGEMGLTPKVPERFSRYETTKKVAQAEKIVRLWEQGLSTAAIAERIGVAQSTISRVLTKEGYDLKAVRRHRYDCRDGYAFGSRAERRPKARGG